MSTGAVVWLLVIVVLFVAAVALVIGSVVSLYRRGRRLAVELDGLQRDVDEALGSARPEPSDRPIDRRGGGLPG